NSMNKELLTVEFRYHDAPKLEGVGEYRTKRITIGIYDTLEEAIIEGNKVIDILSKTFQVRPEDRFKKVHLFGSPCRLVTNTCYHTYGIQYFAKITQLKFDDMNEVVTETFRAYGRYREYKNKEE